MAHFAILEGGIDQHHQHAGHAQQHGRRMARGPQALEADEGQGQQETGNEHGGNRHQPRQQHQQQGADAAHDGRAHVRDVDGEGKRETDDGNHEPGLAQQFFQETELDQQEQLPAQPQHQPQAQHEQQGEQQLDAQLPGDFKIGRIAGDAPAILGAGQHQRVGNIESHHAKTEQLGGNDAQGRARLVVAPNHVFGAARHVVPGQHGQHGGRARHPQADALRRHVAQAGHQQDGQQQADQHQRTQQVRFRGGPHLVLCRAVQPVQQQALQQARHRARYRDTGRHHRIEQRHVFSCGILLHNHSLRVVHCSHCCTASTAIIAFRYRHLNSDSCARPSRPTPARCNGRLCARPQASSGTRNSHSRGWPVSSSAHAIQVENR